MRSNLVSETAPSSPILEPRGCEVRRFLTDQLIKLGHGLINLTRYHCYEPIVIDTRKLGDEQYRAQFGAAWGQSPTRYSWQ